MPAIATLVITGIGTASAVAGQVSQNRAAARLAQGKFDQGQDQLSTQQYNIKQNAASDAAARQDQANQFLALLDLKQKDQAQAAPGIRADNAVRGDVLANVQDVTMSHPRANVVNFEGGLRPSLLSSDTRALGQDMTGDALRQQLAGDAFTPYAKTNFLDALQTSPGVTEPQQPGGLDKFLDVLGTAGLITGGLSQAGGGQTLAGLLARQPRPLPSAQVPQLPAFGGAVPQVTLADPMPGYPYAMNYD